jgi:rhodanese-related sulfurtransferase
MHATLIAILAPLFGWALIPQQAPAGGDSSLITTAAAAQIVAEDSTAVLLDVRTEAEFKGETGHLAKAVLIPVQVLAERIGELKQYKNRVIVVYCRTGHRSTTATEILRNEGYKAYNMAGGITRWRQEDRPTVRE